MLRSKLSKYALCGAVAAGAALAGMPTDAEAGPVRVRFTPPFGVPFNDLEWEGFADISDGSCTETGLVSNLAAPCGGEFSFTTASLTLSSISNPAVSETLNLVGSMVLNVQRSGLTPETFEGVVATPFYPVKSSIAPAQYSGSPAWFSLVMVGGKNVQLYWFSANPGSYFEEPDYYLQCAKPGINYIGDSACGQSTNTAIAVFVPVPEPSTYAMLLAGLGAVGFAAFRRSRKA